MNQTFDNTVLEARADNAVLRKRLHKREDVTLKPNQVTSAPTGVRRRGARHPRVPRMRW